MKFIKILIGIVLIAGTFYLLDNKFGSIPPVGKFISPFTGFWQNNTSMDSFPEEINIPGLQSEVTVVWDDRRVPHIFADNDHDLYMTQGYIVARDRLWQMEFMMLGTAGRLSEVIGSDYLEYDKYRRRLGLVSASENMLEFVKKDEHTIMSMQSFADGVNTYIENLSPADYPVEYKILDYKPEKWTPLSTIIIFKSMAWTLTGNLDDKGMSQTRSVIGEEEMDKLFPLYFPFMDPIIPPGTRWDFEANIPEKPSDDFILDDMTSITDNPDNYMYGSNNWAVSGSKTASGFPMLSNDPHLNLTLPSIWYEVQLNSPEQNAYGYVIPGAPGIILGFNSNIAWGVTNGTSDFLDWYKITYKDHTRNEYLYDGKYLKTEKRIEKYEVRGVGTVLDTVIYTHYGPVVYQRNEKAFSSRIPKGYSIKWTAQDPSNDILTFHGLNKAKGFEDYYNSLKQYNNPSQNFVYADKENIAIWHSGKLPLRWEQQGRYLLDGSNPAHEWAGIIPFEQNPGIKNPKRGFVSSANQFAADKNYPYYLGWSYATYTRGAQINKRLTNMDDITYMDMAALQMDDHNLDAENALPNILIALSSNKLSTFGESAVSTLADWDNKYRSHLIEPILYEVLFRHIGKLIWDDDLVDEDGNRLRMPKSDITVDLIKNGTNSEYIQDKNKNLLMTLDSIVLLAMRYTEKELTDKYDSFDNIPSWGEYKSTSVNHLANIPGFNKPIITSGKSGLVNATSRTAGPSFRLTVSMEEKVKAWSIYPGGQSGNPGSKFYDNMVDGWAIGKVSKINFLKSVNDSNESITFKTKVNPNK